MAELAQDGFRLADGLHYLEFLKRLHLTLKPEWYFEIGTQTGASLRLSHSKSISVDPVFAVRHEVIGPKPELHLFQCESDEFFASDHLTTLGAKIDLAFLDGMHLMEFLLRDFINTERQCSRESVIVMHDCVPWNNAITKRQRETQSWTGDVWKIVPILQKYRPDLELEVVDCAPTGLVIVTGLDANNSVLSDAYDDILSEFVSIDLDDYGSARYFDALDIVSAVESRWGSSCPRLLAEGWDQNPDIAIKVAAPNREVLGDWGDYYFALGLAKAFSRMGYRTSIDPQDEWYANSNPGGLDIVLRGRANFSKQPGRTCVFWSISKRMRPTNFAQADHVFLASGKMYEEALSTEYAEKSSLLPQGFDSEIMRPRQSLRGDGLVFVGRNRSGFERPSSAYAARSGRDLKIWGPGWKGTEFEKYLCADGIDNSGLSEVYTKADIVLNDHTPQMKENGQVSNRIFDTLACGAVPVSDDVAWLPADLREFVYLFEDEESFNKVVKAALSETDATRKKRLEFAKLMQERHSFTERATKILCVFHQLAENREQPVEVGGEV
ncbi:glycosyltransferase family protein [Ruegeria meonggei]|uniref:glycosyltransferase family protein n=1 Tax=Ruegeria meonggei TaxID=1446476 RepID=UPI00366AADC3